MLIEIGEFQGWTVMNKQMLKKYCETVNFMTNFGVCEVPKVAWGERTNITHRKGTTESVKIKKIKRFYSRHDTHKMWIKNV